MTWGVVGLSVKSIASHKKMHEENVCGVFSLVGKGKEWMFALVRRRSPLPLGGVRGGLTAAVEVFVFGGSVNSYLISSYESS